jgi:phosphate transport system substrate-binding protein
MPARSLPVLLIAAAACLSSLGCAGEDDITLQGAGATFPAPLYERWFLEYYKRHPEVRVNYQAIGSGAGIRQFSDDRQLVDFGASDALMKPDEIAKVQSGVLQLPMTAGSIVLCYNIPEFKGELRLSRSVYGRIFTGEIKFWDDYAIVNCQERPIEVKMPHLAITVIHRAEGSGTTYVFTSHLDKVSPDWKNKVKEPGKSVVWPTGLGANGNDGVASLIEQTPGGIGYLEYGYAELAHLPTALLENKEHEYIKPGPESGKAGLAQADLSKYPRLTIPDPPGKDSYPIVTYTWVLCYKKYNDPQVATSLKKVLRFCLTDGQELSGQLGYIPLPGEVRAKNLAAIDTIEP